MIFDNMEKTEQPYLKMNFCCNGIDIEKTNKIKTIKIIRSNDFNDLANALTSTNKYIVIGGNDEIYFIDFTLNLF